MRVLDEAACRRSWIGLGGEQWAAANPENASGQDKVWSNNYGITKTDAVGRMLHKSGIPKDASWLDVGTASGAHADVIRTLGYEDIMGCDLCAPALPPGGVCADATKMPFADDSFDVVTTSGVLMQVGSPIGGARLAVNEFARIARHRMLLCEGWKAEFVNVSYNIIGRDMPTSVIGPWDRYLGEELPDWEVERMVYPDITNWARTWMSVILMRRVRGTVCGSAAP